MHAELDKLLDLQAKDLALLELDLRLKAILDELTALGSRLEAAERAVADARSRQEEGVKRRESLEVRIDSYRVIQDRRRQRLEAARGAREAQALLTEVEMARTVLVREENEWVKLAESVHDLERAFKTAEDALAELQMTLAPDRERLLAEQGRLEAERDAARAVRETAASAIERSIRIRYDRLQAARMTAVVVPLRGEACGACFTAVPRNRRTQIRAGILLDNCEACGVLLYADAQG